MIFSIIILLLVFVLINEVFSSNYIVDIQIHPIGTREYDHNKIYSIVDKIKEKKLIEKKIKEQEKTEKMNKIEKQNNQQNYKKINSNIGKNNTISSRSKDKMNDKNTVLLAKLIQSEALGEPYNGKVAVGAVVLNRMEIRKQTMEEVIYAKSQFSGVKGKLFNQKPSDDCISAAKEALSGSDPTNNSEYFLNKNIASANWTSKFIFTVRIGNHWFYKR